MKDITLTTALELAVFLGYDGQIQQKSKLETDLLTAFIFQLRHCGMDELENALTWLYVKSWGPQVWVSLNFEMTDTF